MRLTSSGAGHTAPRDGGQCCWRRSATRRSPCVDCDKHRSADLHEPVAEPDIEFAARQQALRRGGWRSTPWTCGSRAARSSPFSGRRAAARPPRLRLIAGFEQPSAGRRAHRRSLDGRRAALPAPGEHGVPALRPVPASRCRRQHRLRPEAARAAARRGGPGPAGRRDAGAGPAARLWPRAGSGSCPAASSSAWRWRAP